VGPTWRLRHSGMGRRCSRRCRWTASGVGNGRPYEIGGEFLEVDPPRKLVHIWEGAGIPGGPTTVTYLLEPLEAGTRLTLRHSGFAVPAVCNVTRIAWETSFVRLAEILQASDGAPG